MMTFLLVLKISTLLAVVLMPMVGPKRKPGGTHGLSNLFVNEYGCLEYIYGDHIDHY